MIITFGGKPGAGKSSIGKRLAKLLDCPFFSAGNFLGKEALKRGITIQELDTILRKNPDEDRIIEARQATLAKQHTTAIFDGWMSFYAIPKAFKIFLEVDLDCAAKRILNDPRPDEKQFTSLEEMKNALTKRFEQNTTRYRAVYGVDLSDKKQYDLIFDTSDLSPEEAAKLIFEKLPK